MSDEYDYVLTYLLSRIGDPRSYRGMHLLQHNRMPQEKVAIILESIFSIAGNESFIEPRGDDPTPRRTHALGHPRRYPPGNSAAECETYWRILDEIATVGGPNGKASFNSLKKNLFPNLESMGLLHRFEGVNGSEKYAQLSEDGLNFVQGTRSARRRIFALASERPLAPLLDKLDPILDRFNIVNVMEIMFFLSDPGLVSRDLEDHIYAYKRLRQIERLELHEQIQDRMDSWMGPTVPKSKKLDWHNWLNQAQQMIDQLKQVPGFNVYQNELIMRAGDAEAATFSKSRSQTVKIESLTWHSLEKRDDWEWHHILPVDYATSQHELNLIDSKENLIYIPAVIHRQIPRKDNRMVQLDVYDESLCLVNPASRDGFPKMDLVFSTDVLVDRERLKSMVDYNRMLLALVG